jgi:hypothetical protein
MAKFIIQVNEKSVIGSTEGDSKGNFESTAQCPSCSSKFSAKKSKGQARTIVDIESAVKAGLKRHYEKKHGANK